MEELKELIAKRTYTKSCITRVQTYVNSQKEILSASVEELEARRDKLQSSFEQYEKIQMKILEIDEIDKEDISLVENKYYDTLASINKFVKQLEKEHPKGSFENSKSHTKLPNIELTVFSGKDLTQYKPFIDMFTSTIDNNKSLTNVQKLYYLRKYLAEEALALIINLPLTNESYVEALSLLKKRYDNKARLVTHHINILLDLPTMQKGTASALRAFSSQIKQQVHALNNLEQPTDSWDMLLISILTRKLDSYTNRAYHLDKVDPEAIPRLEDFLSFLEKRATALEDSPQQKVSYETKFNKSVSSKVANIATQNYKKQAHCLFCSKADHPIYMCAKFKTATTAERLEFVNLKKLCHLCLKSHTEECKFQFKCKLCSQKHNTLLHVKEESKVVSLHSSLPTLESVLLPTVKVKVKDRSGQESYIKALLDSGSQVSLITSSLAKKLNLEFLPDNTKIIAVGSEPISRVGQCVKLSISSCDDVTKLKIKCHVVDTITTNLPQNYINTSNIVIPKNIKLADVHFNIPSEISLLLGADYYFNVLAGGQIKLVDGPVLQNTLFGYVIGGAVKCQQNSKQTCNKLVTNFVLKDTSNSLNNIMSQFWLSEKVPEEIDKGPSEFQKAEVCFQSSLNFENNKFTVDIPLKTPMEELQLGDSFSVALQRFHSLENKFKTNPDYFEKYKNFIDEYVKLGHAKIVDISQYNIYNDPVYFLSHHGVQNEESKTTKLRVVFNGSLKSKNSISLNEVMSNGPIVQNELFDILILFRTYKHTLMCDIEKMFRQININPKQTSLQNILWRDDPSKPINCLQLQTITYGLKSSTFLATRCLLELARRNQDRYPLAAKAIIKNMYVDDCIGGGDSIEQLHDLKKELIELLNLGSFKLHKWCSSSVELLDDIPANKKYFEEINLNKDNIIKTLGLKYEVLTDSLTFTSPAADDQELNTKRKILSYIGKIFDPLGLIGPVVVRAKLFMQELWHSKLHWDTILPQNQQNEWKKFIIGLQEMGVIKAKRGLIENNVESVELVGFSDASLKAIGACVYLRIFYKNGNIKVNLLCSKSKVAPINKSLTIPNLELNSAQLLSQLAYRIYNTLEFRFPLKVILHSDSQIVLAWLNSDKVKGAYVSNRINNIKKLTKNFQWCYVRSAENPADMLSRGIAPQKLQACELWWHGPQYLTDPNFIFPPNECKFPIPVESAKQVDCTNVCNANIINENCVFDKYSSLDKLMRIIAYILRFKNNSLNPNNKVSGCLEPRELQYALMVIIKHAQKQAFKTELDLLNNNKNIKSNLSNLNPFLDGFGILRVGGRLQNATNLSYDKKHPAILPKSNKFTDMIIQKEHLRLLHAGQKLLLSSLSQRFWIVNGIREVKKVIHGCIRCFRVKAEAAKQLMGSLPVERITTSRPFQITGVDFCGPFDVKMTRVRNPVITKAYIAVFVCFATKAIHLELVSNLTTETFLACLQRFIARRGCPTQIYCDNAKTFKGAENYLNDLYKLHSSKKHVESVECFCSEKMIRIKYIPSYSPEWGGLWEAGVKSFKFHLKRVAAQICLTFEELYTVVTQIESILNSRPLLPVSSDVSDYKYLTPGHFLVGTSLTSYPELDLSERSLNRLRFWNKVTKIKQDFWKLWSQDYLTQLQNRPKWKYPCKNLKEGDLVIVKVKNAPPMEWPMGRIVKVFPGLDNNVRVAEVKMSNNKTYTRSYNNLCPLPIEKE